MARLLTLTALVLGTFAAQAHASALERFPIGGMEEISHPVRGPDGALWFTGYRGVGRLGPDGHLRVFARNVVSPEGLTVGPDGNLWLTDEYAVYRLTLDGGLTRFAAGIPKEATPGAITSGPDGALWLLEDFDTFGRLARVTTTGQITQFPALHDPGIDDTNLQALVSGPDGQLWFMDSYNVGHMTTTGQVRWLGGESEDEALDATMVVGPDGNIWVAGLMLDALLRITPATEAVTSIKAPYAASQIVFNADGTLWVGGFGVLMRITQDGTVVESAHDPFGDRNDCEGFPSAPGDGFAIDGAGEVWAADLLGDSLVRVTASPTAPHGPLTPVLPNRGDLKEPQSLVAGPDGTIWIATAGAIVRVPPGGPPRTIRHAHVQDLAAARDGSVWFTETHDRVGHLDTRGRLRVTNLHAGLLAGIETDARGEPWFLEPGRVAHLTRTGHVRTFAVARKSRLTDIVAGPDGAMWFTDERGFIGRVTRNGRVHLYRSGAARHRDPAAITRGPDGALWFADTEGRVSSISTRGRVREFKVRESPTAITAGADGALWFVTGQTDYSSGLGRITPDGRVSQYHVRHTCETTPWNIAAAPDGKIWFGELHGPVGVATFDPTLSA